MYLINAVNVNDAYLKGLELLHRVGEESDSRAGRVLVAPMPVVTSYLNPTQRVLFDKSRDANPFFHLMESLWMLAGQNDARWLDQFVGDFSARFGEKDGIQHGAYGYRWRHAFGFDQLTEVIKKLKANPSDRQAVIQMWDCSDYDDLMGDWKDRPCNTHIYLRMRRGDVSWFLDITVCCRSNDVIWGAYGANAVHFSVLQEDLAKRIGDDGHVGNYYQLSNNFHEYVDVLSKMHPSPSSMFKYLPDGRGSTPIVTNPQHFDSDVLAFVKGLRPTFANGFFPLVAVPM